MSRLWLIAICLFAANAFAAAPTGAWWDANYAYRYQITLPTGGSAIPSGYSVALAFNHAAEVTAGRSQASGNDVRIVRWTGTGWVEVDRLADSQASWNSANTLVWFATHAQLDATNDDYYVYFGNSAAPATAPANGSAVFLFHDEFNSNLGNDRWTWSGDVSVDDGVLTVPQYARARSNSTFDVNTIWESRARLSTARPSIFGDFYYWGAANSATFADDHIGFHADYYAHHVENSTNANLSQTEISDDDVTVFRTYSIGRVGASAVRYWINGAINSAPLTTLNNRVPSGNLFVAVNNDPGFAIFTRYQYYDWVRVRRYRSPEPVPTLGALETAAPPAPVGEWRLDQASWNGTANEVINSASNSLHGAASNGAQTRVAAPDPARSGSTGTCRYGSFDGVNDFVQIAHNTALNMTNQLTLSAWVYPLSRSSGGEYKTIVSKDENYEFHLDSNGRVYWWWSASNMTSTGTVPLNQWSHIAVTFQSGTQRIYINGALSGSASWVGTLSTNSDPLQIGQDQGIAARYFNGYIDEVRLYGTALSATQVQSVYNSTHACPVLATADRFVISHDKAGFNCAAETIAVSVRDSTNAPFAGYNQTMTLNTQTSRGTWSLVSGSGAFNDATANDGIATYTWPGSQDSATFALSYPEGQRTFDIDVYQSNNTALRDDDSEGTITFADSGFVVTSAAAPDSMNPPFPTFTSPQTAGTAFPMHIAKYGSLAGTGTCRLVTSYTGSKSIDVWTTYTNPNVQRTTVAVTSGATTTNVGSAVTTMPITFTNGRAQLGLKFKDVGLIALNVRDQYEATLPTPVLTVGSTNGFVVKPATFTVTPQLNGVSHSGASGASGPVFARAGEPFSLVVTALDSEGSATRSFSKESTPEGVLLNASLFAPADGQMPAVSATTAATFADGVATLTGVTWNEVGIVRLLPSVADHDYLGAGDVVGDARNVGRFIPASFQVGKNTPEFQPSCASFTYVGQFFRYAQKPVLTLTPLSVSGGSLQNYVGDFMKLTNTSVTGRQYSARVGASDITSSLVTSALPSPDPAIAAAGGNVTLTFEDGLTGFKFDRTTTPRAEFAPELRVQVNVQDSDGVRPSDGTVQEFFDPIAFQGGFAAQRYGRLAMRNAIGSELVKLPVPMRTEYYVNDTTGFVPNALDACTTGVRLTLSAFSGQLNSGETCAMDTSAPGVSNIGCPTAIAGQRYRPTAIGGDFNLILAAPGSGNHGSVTIAPEAASVPEWLRFDWNGAIPGEQGPSATATFGVFQGISPRRIYQREAIVR